MRSSLIICAGICFCHLLKWDLSYEDVFPAQLEQAGTQTTGSREEPEKWKRRVTFPPICSHTCWCFRAVTQKESPTAWTRTHSDTEWPLSGSQKDTVSSLSPSLCSSECVWVCEICRRVTVFLKDIFHSPSLNRIEQNRIKRTGMVSFCWQILSDITVHNISIVKGHIKGAIQDIQPLFEIKELEI